MGATSTKGLTICMTSPVAGASVVITAITPVPNRIVEVEATGDFNVGDVVKFGAVGFNGIANRAFAITNVTGTGFEIGNVELGAGSLAANPTLSHYTEADMVCLCLSSLSIKKDAPKLINTGTFCDPTASIAGTVAAAGTFEFEGFVNVHEAGYPALIEAEDDGEERIVRIAFPANGYVVAPITVALLTWATPIDGAIGYSGTANMSSKARHVWQ